MRHRGCALHAQENNICLCPLPFPLPLTMRRRLPHTSRKPTRNQLLDSAHDIVPIQLKGACDTVYTHCSTTHLGPLRGCTAASQPRCPGQCQVPWRRQCTCRTTTHGATGLQCAPLAACARFSTDARASSIVPPPLPGVCPWPASSVYC